MITPAEPGKKWTGADTLGLVLVLLICVIVVNSYAVGESDRPLLVSGTATLKSDQFIEHPQKLVYDQHRLDVSPAPACKILTGTPVQLMRPVGSMTIVHVVEKNPEACGGLIISVPTTELRGPQVRGY